MGISNCTLESLLLRKNPTKGELYPMTSVAVDGKLKRVPKFDISMIKKLRDGLGRYYLILMNEKKGSGWVRANQWDRSGVLEDCDRRGAFGAIEKLEEFQGLKGSGLLKQNRSKRRPYRVKKSFSPYTSDNYGLPYRLFP